MSEEYLFRNDPTVIDELYRIESESLKISAKLIDLRLSCSPIQSALKLKLCEEQLRKFLIEVRDNRNQAEDAIRI